MQQAFKSLAGVLAVLLISSSARAAVPQASDLVGAWVSTNTGAFNGFEFSSGGKVMAYIGGGSDAVPADYSISDGRLKISVGQVAEMIPDLSGDQLSLKEPQTGETWTYRRLKPGETVLGAMNGAGAAQAATDQKSTGARNAALPDFLKRTDLVLVAPDGGAHAPPPAAIDFAPNGSEYAGHILFDGKPPRALQFGAQMQGSEQSPTVALSLGTATFDASIMHGEFFFHPVGAAPNITLACAADLGGEVTTNLSIKADAALHQQIMDHFKTELARLNALRTPLVAMLKTYAVLDGTSESPLRAEPLGFADHFVLSLNPQKTGWVGQGQSVNRATGAVENFPVIAAVGIASGKPVIQILSQKRVYQFAEVDTASGKMAGAWQIPNNPTAHAAQLNLTQALDAAGRDELFATYKTSLQHIPADATYHALFADQFGNNAQPPNPIAVTLTVDGSGAVTGSVNYVLIGCNLTLAGKVVDTPVGPQLQLRYTAGKTSAKAIGGADAYLSQVMHETWVLSPQSTSAGELRLMGYAGGTPANSSGLVSLQLSPCPAGANTAVAQALGSGMRFQVMHPLMDASQTDVIQLGSDAAAGKITGHLLTAGHQLNTAANIIFSGDVVDDGGWSEMTMPITKPTDPRAVYAYRIVATQTDDGLALNGYVYNIRMGVSHPLGRWDAVELKK